MTVHKLRAEFETWVRNPHMLKKSSDPGYQEDYEHPWTAGAWEAWKEAHERAKPEAAEVNITSEQWENAINGPGSHG